MPDTKIEKLLTNDSFVRWIKGKSSVAEAAYWENWMSEHKEREKIVHQAEELIRLTRSDELTVPDVQAELKKFETSIYSGSQQHTKRGSNITSIYSPKVFLGAVATALIILVVSVGFYSAFNTNSADHLNEQQAVNGAFSTAYGEKKSFRLSDGSVIILNANSSLEYTSSARSEQSIDVWLKGEAYFDITQLTGDDQRLFRVHTSDGTVEVVGTEFVVKSSSLGTRTVLSEGKIRIKIGSDSTQSDTSFVMKPNEMAHYVSGNLKADLQRVKASVYTSWVNDEWHFDKTPLKEIAQRIEDIYGVRVIFRRTELKQRVLSGSIKSTNLNILKRALSKILDEPVVQQADSTIEIGRTETKK
ncbi:FecR family protein [Fodinibius salsisoli]|uniref:FecR domain-containing protein n=1 Tax=Fodinibius salsisoli TaxID=2820877 RepID=A0ABT3PHC2_9BACT|nr:FecR domain-containing protein [Fodinibius salsisoli]MCW9705319.1 FecR domain-containing protein [Fodinibius salsisoli]